MWTSKNKEEKEKNDNHETNLWNGNGRSAVPSRTSLGARAEPSQRLAAGDLHRFPVPFHQRRISGRCPDTDDDRVRPGHHQ